MILLHRMSRWSTSCIDHPSTTPRLYSRRTSDPNTTTRVHRARCYKYICYQCSSRDISHPTEIRSGGGCLTLNSPPLINQKMMESDHEAFSLPTLDIKVVPKLEDLQICGFYDDCPSEISSQRQLPSEIWVIIIENVSRSFFVIHCQLLIKVG